MEDWPWNVDFKRDGQCPDVLSWRATWKKCGGLWADGVAPTVVTVGARAFAHNNLKLYDDFYYEMCYCTYTVIDISGFYMLLYLLFQGFSLPWINTVNSTAWSSSSFLNPARFGLGCNKTFELPVVWDAIILISTTEMVVYIFSPTTKFYAYHVHTLHCLCMQADGQTDGQGATENEYTPTPIPIGKRYSHLYKYYLVLVLLKVQFLEEK